MASEGVAAVAASMSCSRCVSSGDASGEQWKGALCDNRPSPGNAKSTRAHGRAVPAHRIAGMMATTIARLAPFRGIDFAQTFIAVGTLNTRLILTSGKLDDAGFAKLGEIGLPVREASCRLLHRGALGSPMAPLRRADNSGEVAKCVSGDPVVVLFGRSEHRHFLRPYSSAEIYLNRFLHVDFVAAGVGAAVAPAVTHA
jgi:hypothetical protein